MNTDIQIAFVGLDRSEALEDRIRQRIEKLQDHHDRILTCHVRVTADDKRHQKGTNYSVNVDLQVPGKHLVVSRDPGDRDTHEDPYVAVRDAFDAAQRQLEEHARRVRQANRG